MWCVVAVTLVLLVLVAQVYGLGKFKDLDLDDVINAKTVIRSGILYGNIFKFVGDDIFQAWTDIPYAKPPTGDQRYREADSEVTWSEPRNVTAKKPERCLQYNFISDKYNRVEGTEEACLMLSIYRYLGMYFENRHALTEIGVRPRLGPVIVLLHPGTYMYDFPFDPRRFAANLCCDFFVTVVVNYRLAHTGFLSMGRHKNGVKANLGLLDQVAALKWVQRNIEAFYGDSNKVSLVGVGAGAAAVQLHLLSSMSRGLFRSALSYSGSALVPWAIGGDVGKKSLNFVRHNLNCTSLAITEIAECLRSISLNALFKEVTGRFNHPLFHDFQNMPLSPLGPVVDNNFLDDDPLILLRAGAVTQMPYLFSFTDSAGILPAAHLFEKEVSETRVENEWNTLAPTILDYNYTMHHLLHEKFAERARKFYYPDYENGTKPLLFDNYGRFIKMLTDRLYTTGIVEGARLQGVATKNDSVYMYRYSYQGEFSFSDQIFGSRQLFGPAVADDFMTYIANQFPVRNFADRVQKQMLTHIFLGFIEFGWADLPQGHTINDTFGLHFLVPMATTKQYFKGASHPQQKRNARGSRIVSYNHLPPSHLVAGSKKHESYAIKHSNDLGKAKFWRRAPILHPTIRYRDRGLYPEILNDEAWDDHPHIDDVLNELRGIEAPKHNKPEQKSVPD
uniref:Seminal fluid protein n=2 Tax=Nilaparvata lugens TaxID=108931 RepID=A0A1I9WL25_NILLU|nr:seminal fluid protein [Nilaparvata lugens]